MSTFKPAAAEIRKVANTYPGAYEESPWGELVVKVKGKVFVFLGRGEGDVFGISVKLPSSSGLALSFPFASPTGYGLGKSGWVSARFEKGQDVPVGLLLEWIDESYRAVAPKTLVKELDAAKGGAPAEELAPTRTEAEKKAEKKTKKKTPAKKATEKKAKKTGTVLVVSDDDLRLARAKKAIASEGLGKFVGAGVDDAFAAVSRKKPVAVIVDLGRRAPAALELGVQLSHALGATPLVFAGARDAATVKKARRAADSVHAARREPPGDPAVIAALAEALG